MTCLQQHILNTLRLTLRKYKATCNGMNFVTVHSAIGNLCSRQVTLSNPADNWMLAYIDAGTDSTFAVHEKRNGK